MGPSGLGKTTLLSILAGLLMPAAGSVLTGEETSMSRAELTVPTAKYRFYFSEFHLFPALTAAENIELVLKAFGGGSATTSASLAGSWVRDIKRIKTW